MRDRTRYGYYGILTEKDGMWVPDGWLALEPINEKQEYVAEHCKNSRIVFIEDAEVYPVRKWRFEREQQDRSHLFSDHNWIDAAGFVAGDLPDDHCYTDGFEDGYEGQYPESSNSLYLQGYEDGLGTKELDRLEDML